MIREQNWKDTSQHGPYIYVSIGRCAWSLPAESVQFLSQTTYD